MVAVTGVSTPAGQIPLNFPLGCGPGPDPPQLTPWVWAWIISPFNFFLGCGPGDLPPPKIPISFPLGSGPGNLQGMLGYHTPSQDQIHPPGPVTPPAPVNRITDACENITLLQLRNNRLAYPLGSWCVPWQFV